MAGLNDDINKARKNLENLKKEYKDLTNLDSPFSDPGDDIKSINDQISQMGTLLEGLRPDLDYISKSFNQSLQEISKQNHALNLQRSALKGIASQANTIVDVKLGETSIDEKSIKKAQEKYRQYIKNLEISKDILENEGKNTDAITNQIQEAKLVDNEFKKVLQRNKEINKQLGIAPQLAGGIDKALQKIGFPSLGITEALDDTHKLGQAAKENNQEFSATSSFLKKVGSNLKENFSYANIMQLTIGGIVAGLLSADKATEELARGLGVSMDAAHTMRRDFAEIANYSGDINVTVKGLQESQMAMSSAVGTRAQLNKDDLVTMTKMVKTMGLQHSELAEIEKLSLINGKSLDDNTKEILGGARAYASRNKLVVNEKEILKEVNSASASLKLSLGGSAEAVAKAAVQAKQFGLNLEQADKMASSLLDFESSIESELSAELITGKNLNFERARGLALNGKTTEAAAEIAKQVGSSAEFGKMNVIQQEAIAKAAGLSRDELAKSLIDREALAKMSGVEGANALEKYNNLKSQGKSQAEIVKLLGEEAAVGLEAQSNQAKMASMMEKLQGIFIQIGDALMPVFDILGKVFEIVGPIAGVIGEIVGFVIDWGKYLLPVIAAYQTFQVTQGVILGIQKAMGKEKSKTAILETKSFAQQKGALAIEQTMLAYQKLKLLFTKKEGRETNKNFGKSMGTMLTNVIGGMAKAGPIGVILGLALAAGAAALVYSQMKDGVIGPGGETVVSGPKGSIQLDKEDSMIVGTDLGGKKKKSKQTGDAGGSVNVDMGPTNALLQQLINVIQTGGAVTLDGAKVGEALKLGSYEVQ
jgi:hypothetical protein